MKTLFAAGLLAVICTAPALASQRLDDSHVAFTKYCLNGPDGSDLCEADISIACVKSALPKRPTDEQRRAAAIACVNRTAQ